MNKLKETLDRIQAPDQGAMEAARKKQDTLTKPRGSLGKLEELSIQMAGIMRRPDPLIKDKVIITFAGDHGVVEEKVNLYPQEVTAQMVLNFLNGGAGINVIADHVGARVVIVDMGVATDYPKPPALVDRAIRKGTGNMAHGPAMTGKEAVQALTAGIEVTENEIQCGMDILGIGEMGIGNTTASSAITAVITGLPAHEVTGKGTGLNTSQVAHKAEVIERSIGLNKPDPSDPIDVLSKIGGFEIGGMAGAILGAAAHGIPLIVDGFIATAAALIAVELCPVVKQYLIAGHKSTEKGHIRALEHLGLDPLLHLEMRLGEGTGAALAMSIVEASVRILNEMATFQEAGVSEASDKS
jgi:nicotinate-nucleotide--dimethylbenzimidazole phosphoribosyltransferase